MIGHTCVRRTFGPDPQVFLRLGFHHTVSLHLTAQEWKSALKGLASVLRHLLTGGLLVALDFLVFWILDQGRHLVEKDVVARGETL